jgi:hypothetical protein
MKPCTSWSEPISRSSNRSNESNHFSICEFIDPCNSSLQDKSIPWSRDLGLLCRTIIQPTLLTLSDYIGSLVLERPRAAMKQCAFTLFALGVLANVQLVYEPASAAPGVQPWNTGCNRLYNQWKKKPKHKAFVVSTSTSGQACGVTWGYPTIESAKKNAVIWCNKAHNVGANCVITKAE